MSTERAALASLVIPNSAKDTQHSNREVEQGVTALPQMSSSVTDPWAPYRRSSTDTLDNMPTPVDHHTTHPYADATGQATVRDPTDSAPPPYSVTRKPYRLSRFPIKTQTAAAGNPQCGRMNVAGANEASNDTFHNVDLGDTGRSSDLERQNIAVQYKGVQGAWPRMKRHLIISGVVAVVITIAITVACLELRKKDSEEFGKI